MFSDLDIEMRIDPFNPQSMIQMNNPEVLDYDVDTSRTDKAYKYSEKTIKIIKPIVYNDGKTFKFTINSNGFIDPERFTLDFEVENKNLNNYLQLDGSAHSLIKCVTFIHDGRILERIDDYDIITNFLNDLHFKENKYNENNKYGDQFDVATREELIEPKQRGAHIIFNPPQTSFKILKCKQVTNGLLDFTASNVKHFKVHIFSYLFGKGQKISKMIPMFLFKNLEVIFDLNPHAFFVPVFHAKIQDLINANINNNEYEVYRACMNELHESKKIALSLRKHPNPLTNFPKSKKLNAKNCSVHLVVGLLGNCLFDAVAIGIYNEQTKGAQVRQAVVKYMEANYDTMQPFTAGEAILSQEVIRASAHAYHNRFGVEPPLPVFDIDEEKLQFKNYIRELQYLDLHGGKPELVAISNLFNTPVEVYDSDLKLMYTINFSFPKNALMLQYIQPSGTLPSGHYNLITFNEKSVGINNMIFEPSDFFNFDVIQTKFSNRINLFNNTTALDFIDYDALKAMAVVYGNTMIQIIQNKSLFQHNGRDVFIFKRGIPDNDIYDPIRKSNWMEFISKLNLDWFSVNNPNIDDFTIGHKKSHHIYLQLQVLNMDLLRKYPNENWGRVLRDKKIRGIPTDIFKADIIKSAGDKFGEDGLFHVEDYIKTEILRNADQTLIDRLALAFKNKDEMDLHVLLMQNETTENFDNIVSDYLLGAPVVLFRRSFNQIVQILGSKLTRDNILDITSDRVKVFNNIFLKKLLQLFEPAQVVEVLKKYIPKMFDYKRFTDFIVAKLNTQDFEAIFFNVSLDFFKQFMNVTQLEKFNPFDVAARISSKLSNITQKDLLKQLINKGKLFKNSNNFTFSYGPNSITPVVGLLSKIVETVNANPGDFDGKRDFAPTFDEGYLRSTMDKINLFSNKKNMYRGGVLPIVPLALAWGGAASLLAYIGISVPVAGVIGGVAVGAGAGVYAGGAMVINEFFKKSVDFSVKNIRTQSGGNLRGDIYQSFDYSGNPTVVKNAPKPGTEAFENQVIVNDVLGSSKIPIETQINSVEINTIINENIKEFVEVTLDDRSCDVWPSKEFTSVLLKCNATIPQVAAIYNTNKWVSHEHMNDTFGDYVGRAEFYKTRFSKSLEDKKDTVVGDQDDAINDALFKKAKDMFKDFLDKEQITKNLQDKANFDKANWEKSEKIKIEFADYLSKLKETQDKLKSDKIAIMSQPVTPARTAAINENTAKILKNENDVNAQQTNYNNQNQTAETDKNTARMSDADYKANTEANKNNTKHSQEMFDESYQKWREGMGYNNSPDINPRFRNFKTSQDYSEFQGFAQSQKRPNKFSEAQKTIMNQQFTACQQEETSLDALIAVNPSRNVNKQAYFDFYSAGKSLNQEFKKILRTNLSIDPEDILIITDEPHEPNESSSTFFSDSGELFKKDNQPNPIFGPENNPNPMNGPENNPNQGFIPFKTLSRPNTGRYNDTSILIKSGTLAGGIGYEVYKPLVEKVIPNFAYIPPPPNRILGNAIEYIGQILEASIINVGQLNFEGVGVGIVAMLLQMIEILSFQSSNPLYSYLLTSLVPVVAAISYKLKNKKKMTPHDRNKLLALPQMLNDRINEYNKIKGTEHENILDGLFNLDNPEEFENLIKKLEAAYPYMIKNKLQPQSDYTLMDNESNINAQLDVSRAYNVKSAVLELHEYHYSGKLPSAEEKKGYEIKVLKYKIVKSVIFSTFPPKEMKIAIPTNRVKSIYNIITNTAYFAHPTYRKTTRFSRQINKFGMNIGGINYPQNYLKDNNSTSSTNDKYMDHLGACFNLGSSTINRFNCALDNSTTMYVTKKLNGYADSNLFKFTQETNMLLDFNFGYTDEILGKNILGFNFREIMLNTKHNIDMKNKEIKIHIENTLDPQTTDTFSMYEIHTILEFRELIKINHEGNLI